MKTKAIRMFKVSKDDRLYSLITENDIIIGTTEFMDRFVGMNIDEAVNQLWYDKYDVEEVDKGSNDYADGVLSLVGAAS